MVLPQGNGNQNGIAFEILVKDTNANFVLGKSHLVNSHPSELPPNQIPPNLTLTQPISSSRVNN